MTGLCADRPSVLLGGGFMRSVYTVLDVEKRQVGFFNLNKDFVTPPQFNTTAQPAPKSDASRSSSSGIAAVVAVVGLTAAVLPVHGLMA